MNEMKEVFLRTIADVQEKHLVKWTENCREDFKLAEESAKSAQRDLADFTSGDLEATQNACQDFLDAFTDLQQLRRQRNEINRAFNLVKEILAETL